jgi:hypothetical protein
VVCLVALTGCVPPIVRSHVAVPLASGEPRTPCETSRWIDLEATELTESASTGGWRGITYSVTTTASGFALYRRREGPSAAPIGLDLALPSLAEPSLARHLRPIDDLRERQHTSLMVLAAGGLIGMTGATTGMLLATTNVATDTVAVTTALVSASVGSLVMIVSAFLAPSPERRNHARLRERLFIPGEDDFDAVGRGVARYNLAMRARCLREATSARAAR